MYSLMTIKNRDFLHEKLNSGLVSLLDGAHTVYLTTIPTTPTVLHLAQFINLTSYLALRAFAFVILVGGIRDSLFLT